MFNCPCPGGIGDTYPLRASKTVKIFASLAETSDTAWAGVGD